MVNEFGVHVGVGEVCAASGPAHSETAMAGISGRIAMARVRITFSISKPVYQTRPSLVKLPITPGSGRRGDLVSASSRSRTFSQRRVNGLLPQEPEEPL